LFGLIEQFGRCISAGGVRQENHGLQRQPTNPYYNRNNMGRAHDD
jgi:hypothetical protein